MNYDPQRLFDADYFAAGFGSAPYLRDAGWMDFFGHVADRIVSDIGPRTVLESGAKRADERLALDDLRRATKVMARALADWLAPTQAT